MAASLELISSLLGQVAPLNSARSLQSTSKSQVWKWWKVKTFKKITIDHQLSK